MPLAPSITLQFVGNVPTDRLVPRDLLILCDPQCPGHLANANDLSGALYRIPGHADELRETLAELARLGFSDRFRRIIADLYRREVPLPGSTKPELMASSGPTINHPARNPTCLKQPN